MAEEMMPEEAWTFLKEQVPDILYGGEAAMAAITPMVDALFAALMTDNTALAQKLEARLRKEKGMGWHPYAVGAATIAKEAIDALRNPAPAPVGGDVVERAVMVCPQCEGEGRYADGLDEAACSTDCTRCGGNGWIVDRAALQVQPAQAQPSDLVERMAIVNYLRGLKRWEADYAGPAGIADDIEAGKHRTGEPK